MSSTLNEDNDTLEKGLLSGNEPADKQAEADKDSAFRARMVRRLILRATVLLAP